MSRSLRSSADNTWPSRVRALRERLGLSQEALARLMRVSVDSVRAWEAGRRTVGGPAQVLLNLMENDIMPPQS